LKLLRPAFPRPAFGGLLLAVLLLMTVSEMALGIATYSRLRRELEADLAQRLVNVAKLLAVGTDVSLVTQFREGDEQIPAYQLVASRFVVLARAAGVERVYVVDDRLETLVDSSSAASVGRVRYALLANRVEVNAAKAGEATPTRIYQDEEGRLRLSALAPLRAADGRVVALAGVDATPEFFSSLDALRRQMVILGVASILTAGAAGLLLVRQVSRRLRRLRRLVSRVSRGDFAERVGLRGGDEIGALGEDLDGMVAALVASRDYYESVLGSAEVGLLATDRQAQVIGANARAAKLLALEAGQLAGRPLGEVLAREPRLLQFVGTLLGGEAGPLAEEIPLQEGLASGGRVVAAVGSRLRQGGTWTGIILSLSDITDQRALEKKVQRNESLAGLGSMAAGLLHEIRNPLASMIMYLDLLRPLAAAGEGQEILDRAMIEAARLERFLQDFQIFAGLRPLRREPVDVREVVEEATEGLSPGAGVRLVRRLGEKTVLFVDRSLLAHAVRNLVVNALQAVGPRGLVELELAREGPEVVLRVTDDGPGISDGSMEQIFDPWFTTKSGGTGLGLTIVQRVAEAHGAALAVRNTPGGGASFSMRWTGEAAGP
jgi:signal transduction histidine kinase/HAMP domain-containing protein